MIVVKRFCALCLVLLLVVPSALADPLALLEDYADEIVILNDESDPSAGKFMYSYRYPHVDGEAPGGTEINVFYSDLVDYTLDFTIPMNQDAFEGEDASTVIDYQVTCNNDRYFSVLVRTVRNNSDQSLIFWEGHVFSRENPTPGMTYTLPKLLGILESAENDTWLQDRQTAKADKLLREMVWDAIDDNERDIDYYPDFTREQLEQVFFPEDHFYLDENGDPVFYLQPGIAAPESAGLLTFPISLEDILDEM